MQTTVDDMATEMAEEVSSTISGLIVNFRFARCMTCAVNLQAVFNCRRICEILSDETMPLDETDAPVRARVVRSGVVGRVARAFE